MDKQKELNCEFYDNGKCSINDKNNLCDCQNNCLICSKIVAKTLTEEVRKQKEIEEMAKDLYYGLSVVHCHCHKDCSTCEYISGFKNSKCDSYSLAYKLYHLGYRKIDKNKGN